MGSVDSPGALGPRRLCRTDFSHLRTHPGCGEVSNSFLGGFLGDSTFCSINQDTHDVLAPLLHQRLESKGRTHLPAAAQAYVTSWRHHTVLRGNSHHDRQDGRQEDGRSGPQIQGWELRSFLQSLCWVPRARGSPLLGQLRSSDQFSWVAQSCPTLCDPMDCSTPGFSVHHQLPKLAQTHVHWVSDAIQPSHPLSSPSPPAFNLAQHRGLFKWVSSLHQVAQKYWSFSFSISPSNEYSGLISFRMEWLDLLAVQETLKSLLQNHSSKASILQRSAFFMVQLSDQGTESVRRGRHQATTSAAQ